MAGPFPGAEMGHPPISIARGLRFRLLCPSCLPYRLRRVVVDGLAGLAYDPRPDSVTPEWRESIFVPRASGRACLSRRLNSPRLRGPWLDFGSGAPAGRERLRSGVFWSSGCSCGSRRRRPWRSLFAGAWCPGSASFPMPSTTGPWPGRSAGEHSTRLSNGEISPTSPFERRVIPPSWRDAVFSWATGRSGPGWCRPGSEC